MLNFDPGSLACAALVAECEAEGACAPPSDGLRERIAKALILASRSVSFSPSEGRIAALVFEAGLDYCAKTAISAASALLEGDGPKLRVAVGRPYELWIDAPRAYAEATASLAYRLVRDPTRPFLYVQAAEDRDALAELKSREEKGPA